MTAELPRGIIAISLANVSRDMHDAAFHRDRLYTRAQIGLILNAADLDTEYADVLESYITSRSTPEEFETEIRNMLAGEAL